MNPLPATTIRPLTPPGRGGIAVLALLGPAWEPLLRAVFNRNIPGEEPDHLTLGMLYDETGEAIDEVLICPVDGGAEIHCHGGPASVRAILETFRRLGAEVLPADGTPEPVLPICHPAWSNPAVGAELLAALPGAPCDRGIDLLASQWSAGLSQLAREQLALPCPNAELLLRAAERHSLVHPLLDPPEVVLAGPPNAGKSTLANALVGRAVSIVHGRAGTTRDWVRELARIGGVGFHLTDTAGLWTGDHPLDAESVRRAMDCIRRADLVLLLGAGQKPETPEALPAERLLLVATQTDRLPVWNGADIGVSAETGDGLDALGRVILERLGLADIDPEEPAAFTDRQERLLRCAANAARSSTPEEARSRLIELLEGAGETSPAE